MSGLPMVLVGAGGHARSCIDVIEQCGSYKIAGLVGLPQEVGALHLGHLVVADDGDLTLLAERFQLALVTVGQTSSADTRVRLFHRLMEVGFDFPTIISPLAYVSKNAIIGAGSIVMHGAVVNAGAVIGRNCIVNTRALVEHDVSVGDHSHVATGVILNGGVQVGSETHIGSGSVIKEGVVIGNLCLVGMGLSVRHDVADGIRFVGKLNT